MGEKGVPGWVGQIAAGCVIAVLSWALGAGSERVGALQRVEMTLTEVCKQMEEKRGIDAQQTRDIQDERQRNAVQDRDLDQLFNHLRLPRR